MGQKVPGLVILVESCPLLCQWCAFGWVNTTLYFAEKRSHFVKISVEKTTRARSSSDEFAVAEIL